MERSIRIVIILVTILIIRMIVMVMMVMMMVVIVIVFVGKRHSLFSLVTVTGRHDDESQRQSVTVTGCSKQSFFLSLSRIKYSNLLCATTNAMPQSKQQQQLLLLLLLLLPSLLWSRVRMQCHRVFVGSFVRSFVTGECQMKRASRPAGRPETEPSSGRTQVLGQCWPNCPKESSS